MAKSRYTINPLVLVGVPTLSKAPLSWQWMDGYRALQFPLGASVSHIRIYGQLVGPARDAIVDQALQMNADYVMFLGDDVIPPANIFDLLRRHREYMVTGVYWTKQYPPLPYLWNGLLEGPYLDWKAGEYFPLDWAGCDALLVHTDVFRKIPAPWFSHEWLFEASQNVPTTTATEDLYFYTKAKTYGFQLYCDTAVQCEHQERSTGATFGLRDDMPQLQAAATIDHDAEPILVADIGAGMDTPFFGFHSVVTRYDSDPACNPDVRCDVRAIPCAPDHFDIVHARHVLEHFRPDEAPDLVREWIRILKPGGELQINVPNIAYAAREILRADEGADDVTIYPLWQLYGRQDGSEGELHKNGFTRRALHSLLESSGLEDVTVEIGGDLNENLIGRGTKSATAAPFVVGPAWRALMGEGDIGEGGGGNEDLPPPAPASLAPTNGHNETRTIPVAAAAPALAGERET